MLVLVILDTKQVSLLNMGKGKRWSVIVVSLKGTKQFQCLIYRASMSITLYIHSVESNALLDLQVYPSIHKFLLGDC